MTPARCPLCGSELVREYCPGEMDYYVCCPASHYEPGHTCYLEGDVLE